MKWTVVLLMVVTLGLAVSINPAVSKQASAEIFKTMDKNGDQKVNVEEYIAVCKHGKDKCIEEFKWFDRNNDGNMTLPEYEGKVKK